MNKFFFILLVSVISRSKSISNDSIDLKSNSTLNNTLNFVNETVNENENETVNENDNLINNKEFLIKIAEGETYFNFSSYGGLSSGYNTSVAINNTKILNSILNFSYQKRDIVIEFPENNTFWFNGGIYGIDIKNLTFIVDGSVNFISDRNIWPTEENKSENVKECIMLDNIDGFKLQSNNKDKGLINGNGEEWWGIVNYLVYKENRPRLFHIRNSSDIVVKNILFKDSPYWTFYAEDVIDMEVMDSDIDVRRTDNNYHSLYDLTAFNTDGFDVSGKNIYIHDVNIWNQDDCIAVKSQDKSNYRSKCSENMLFSRINASGVGLTIGSIGGSVSHSCIRNITFKDSEMYNTFKGIYMKSRPEEGPNRTGEITNILYQNISIYNATQWPIWIGPQQAIYKGACSLLWPYVPYSKCYVPSNINWTNIVLRDINITNPSYSPGVILGNESNGINGLVFDNVIVNDNVNEYDLWKKDYICKGVIGKAKGKTSPIPSCLDYYLSDINKKGDKTECELAYNRNSYLGFMWR